MTARTVFLAWQDQALSRQWFPIGRLDADPAQSRFRFRYIHGVDAARREAGLQPLEDFPDLNKDYHSAELFPLFKNRVITPGRPDFAEYLRQLDLPDSADPIEILSVGGGARATDFFQVFPKIERQPNGTFCCRFFLHGWRYRNEAAQQRLETLEPGEKLHVALELTNPVTRVAIQLQTIDYVMIGWAPRYLVYDLARTTVRLSGDYAARVVRLNPVPAPSKQRLLVELSGPWPDDEPMSTAEFEPLVP
jgi:hypothetical protein